MFLQEADRLSDEKPIICLLLLCHKMKEDMAMTYKINLTITDSKNVEKKKAIQTIYKMIWDVIALYEPTEAYNKVPNDEEKDCWDYMSEQLLNIRKELGGLFLDDQQLIDALERIIDETEIFVKCYEVPGVVNRWKRINTNLLFFDCAFDLMSDAPECYKEICRGLTDLKLSCYPDKELIDAQKNYFENWKQKCEKGNLQYSQERIFQNELHQTLSLVFKNDFKEYL